MRRCTWGFGPVLVLVWLAGCATGGESAIEESLGPIEQTIDPVMETVWPGVETETGRHVRRVNGFHAGEPATYWLREFPGSASWCSSSLPYV